MTDLVDPQPTDDAPYQPRDAVGRAVGSATTTGAAGLLLAAVQNTVAKEGIGALGIFSRFGTTVALFAGMGGAYAFVSTASSNLREKKDAWNDALGGFSAGALVGLRKRAFPSVIGNGLALGAILAGVSYSGSLFGSTPTGPTVDNVARKEEARKRFRRPIQETVNEIGEGRGIYPPGYDERRKQRIKQNYGIDIEEPYYKREAASGA